MSSSQRVLFLDSLFVIQSCFLSTMPPFSCGYFLRDFHDFLHSHTRSCLSQQPLSHRSALTTSWDVATRLLSVFSLRRRFRRCYFKALAYTAAQIVTSPLTPPGTIHCCWLAVSSLTIRPDLRATHCPVRAIVDSQHRHASSGRHTPSETHACRSPTTPSRSLPPSALQPRLYGASHHFKRLRASSPRRAPLHAAHASSQLRIIACSWAPFSPLLSHRPHQRSTLVFISRDSRTFPRTIIANDNKTHGHIGHFTSLFISCFIYFCHVI